MELTPGFVDAQRKIQFISASPGINLWPNFTTSETVGRIVTEINHFKFVPVYNNKESALVMHLPEAGSVRARPFRNSVSGVETCATQGETTSLMLSKWFPTSQGTSDVTQ